MIYENIALEEMQKLGNFSKFISTEIIGRALCAVELGIVQKWMGRKSVAEFVDYSEEIKQKIYKTIAILANAWVMKNSTFTTRSGAVEKQTSSTSKVLEGGELNAQVSQMRMEARQLLKYTEELVVEQGFPPFEWSKEENVLNLWHLSF